MKITEEMLRENAKLFVNGIKQIAVDGTVIFRPIKTTQTEEVKPENITITIRCLPDPTVEVRHL